MIPDHSIDPRILESAKAEFMEKGFEKAALKTICDNAGVTTGALYKRYDGKEGLFNAVVADVIADLSDFSDTRSAADPKMLSDEELINAWDMGHMGNTLIEWFRFLDKRRDGFVLLISRAEGTRYANFQHDWVDKMCDATYGYYLEAKQRGLFDKNVSKQEMHILLTSFWTTVYEPFIHGYDWEQIESHCKLVCRLFNWKEVFGFHSN